MENSENATIEIFYEKNPLYRTIYADGVFGGITPTNSVNLSFFATRNTIPKSMIHEIVPESNMINPQGKNGEGSKVGIMREIEVGLYMNKDTARDMYHFLKKLFEPDVK